MGEEQQQSAIKMLPLKAENAMYMLKREKNEIRIFSLHFQMDFVKITQQKQ